jgi:hypothetical protein
MDLRDFRVGWRMLVREPAYSMVVVLGMAVGFAICFLLLGFVRYSFSYDAHVPDAERIYLIKHKANVIAKPSWYESTPLPFLEAARRSGQVESATALMNLPVDLKGNGQTQRFEITAVHPEFASIFGLRALDGDLQAALSRPDALALTERTATQLFGSTDVVGKTVQITGQAYTIAALLPDPPLNSTISYAILASITTKAWPEKDRNALFWAWSQIGAKLYVKLLPNGKAEPLERFLQDAADNSPLSRELPADMLQSLGQQKIMDIRLGALPTMYFDQDTANMPMSGPHGDLRVVLGLAAVALLILLLAVCNYVNLATVRTLRRQSEIAVRKVLGASIGRLTAQFLTESLLVALLATLLGLLLAALMLPAFTDLIGVQLGALFTAGSVAAALALGIVVGLAAGAYPAWVAQRIRPAQTLAGRGSHETLSGLWLRRVLSVFQFSVAIALISITLTIALQTRFASNIDPGFDPSELLVLELPANQDQAPAKGLRAALERIPGVKGVAAAENPIGTRFIGMNMDVSRVEGQRASVVTRAVSLNFFDVYGVKPVAGRMFDPAVDQPELLNTVVVNAATTRALGYAAPAEAVGQMLTAGGGENARSARIIGIAPDIRHESLRDVQRPLVYYPAPTTPVLTVRASGDIGSIERAADELQRQYFPDSVVAVRRASSYFAANYAYDVRLARMLTLASLIAVAIATFGIYVLSAYNIRRLSKQIVLRKLFGAGRLALVRMVGREFAIMLAVSTAIALPIALLASQNYLATFVERAPIGAWPMLAAVLAAALVTVASTLQHTLTALRLSPVKILRE